MIKHLSRRILLEQTRYYSLCIRHNKFDVLFRFKKCRKINSIKFLSLFFSKGRYDFIYSDDEFYDPDPDSRQKNSMGHTVFKTCLFPENHDPDLQKILHSDIKGILEVAEGLNPLTIEQASQAIVSFHDIKKPAAQGYFNSDESYCIMSEIESSQTFNKVLLVINNEFDRLPNEVLVTTLLALSRLQIPEKENFIIENLLIESCRRLPKLSLREVSKLTSVMKCLQISVFYVASALEVISSQIDTCNNDEILKYVAISLNNTCHLASLHCIRRFAHKVEEFILQGQDMSYKTSLACLAVFGKYDWKREFIDLQQHLLTFVIDFVPMLSAPELVLLFWNVIVCDCNVNTIVPALEKRTLELVKNSSNFLEKLVLLNCVRSTINKLQHKLEVKSYLEECTKDANPQKQLHVHLMLSTLLNTNPLECEPLVETFLRQAFATLPFYSLLYCCRSYLFMKMSSNRLRHHKCQENPPDLSNILKSKIQNCIKSDEIAFFTAMWIANSISTISLEHMQKLLDILPQLDIFASTMVSLAVNLAFRSSKILPFTKEDMLYKINYSLFEISKNRLSESVTLQEYNLLLQTVSVSLNRASLKSKIMRFEFGWDLTNGYNRFLEDRHFSPKTIFLASKILRRHKICLPRFLESMACNIVERPSCQYGESVAMLLAYCYTVNYCPQVPGFLAKCQEIVASQNESIKCYSILNSALSAGLFQALDEKLIKLIFHEAFVEKLEKEIAVSSRMKSNEVQFSLAVFNRLVCIDYPEFNLPWFHEQFYQNVHSNSSKRLHLLEEDVFRLLYQVLPEEQCLSVKPFAPYYTEISFECQLDKSNYPIMYSNIDIPGSARKVQTSSGLSSDAQRIAVDVLWESSFCRNMRKLLGPEVLKQRHLEILGYKVVQIPFYEWNSLQLSKTEAKIDYLHTKIFQ